MTCKESMTVFLQGLTLTSSMAVMGFVIGAIADHMTNQSFETVVETGGMVGAGFGCAGFLISVGMFAVSSSSINDNNEPDETDPLGYKEGDVYATHYGITTSLKSGTV